MPQRERRVINSTHGDDDEVEPAPGVREVLLKAVSTLLDDHLEEEDHRERPVHVLEHHLQRRLLFDVHVLDRLTKTSVFYYSEEGPLEYGKIIFYSLIFGGGIRYDTIRDAILTCARKPT